MNPTFDQPRLSAAAVPAVRTRSPLQRLLALTLAAAVALLPASPALAQRKSATNDGLADEPISAKNSAKPNIMMTLDDSGSMSWDFLPDQTVGPLAGILNGGNYCRTASGAMAQACGGGGSILTYQMYTQAGYPLGTAPTPPRPALWAPAGRVPAFNGVAYDPSIEYKPPLKATFDPSIHNANIPSTTYAYPEQDSAQTVNWTQVQVDPYLAPATKVSMNNTAVGGKVTVGRWCNSDYPTSETSGDECRVNGKAYPAGANGAPAVANDWNYPVQPTGFNANSSKPNAAIFPLHRVRRLVQGIRILVRDREQHTNAGGTGTDCRRNNKAYASSPAVTAKRDNYPDATYKYRLSQGTDTIPNVTDAAWHYWRGAVEWCKSAVPAAGSGLTTKWQGFGAWAAGNCQTFPNSTYKYPRFYKYMQSPGYDNVANQALELVTLDFNSPATHDASYVDGTGVTVSQTRPFATDTYNAGGELIKRSEMTNFANWFAYYRTRVMAAKTAASRAFGNLDKDFRVGYGVFNYAGYRWLNVSDFDVGGTPRSNWYTNLSNTSANGGTPTFAALTRVGEYFRGGSSPITLSCQKNWHILFTDGYANDTSGITGPAGGVNVDGSNVPNPLPPPYWAKDVVANYDPTLIPGSSWPYKYREGTTPQTNTLADLATYYWVTDLKTSGATAPNNVPADSNDPASWQHVNFAAISFGTRGTLDVTNQATTMANLSSGTTRWPAWVSNGPEAVDDLWHAAVNGRGRFVNARNPDELAMGLAQILQDIANQGGSRVGVAFTTVTVSPSANYVYKVSFEGGWGGSLKKVKIDPATGNEVKDALGKTIVAWSAGDKLATLLTPSVADPTPWLSDKPATARKIVTMNGNSKVPFRWDQLSGTQQGTLDADTTRQQRIVEYLRGSRLKEGFELGKFRMRSKDPGVIDPARVLGDIVNSQPIYVGPTMVDNPLNPTGPKIPYKPYLDINDPGYSTFAATYKNRAARVYVGANDGMLHAFDEATGREVWAYVPKPLYRAGNAGLGGLSYQDGGVPTFRHHYYVDSTPRAADVRLDGTWKTILVGGLGKGGSSYYAIDVTSPGDPATEKESDIAAKLLWEFTDADMGYTYGRPVIAKTYAYGWVMIVPTGYDNPTGEGKVFVVDLKTGTKLHTFTTGVGTPSSPSGLAHISGYTKDYRNQYVEQIYGGDLFGNMWRFDVSKSVAGAWPTTGDRIATLTDGTNPQPITTPPQIEVDIANGVDRWVFIGTGRLLDNDDLASTQIQTMYAIRDGTFSTPKAAGLPASRSSMIAVTSVDPLASKPVVGWYDDLPAGQRIITPVAAEASIVAYSASRPQTDPCLPGQPATLYAREVSKGGSRLQASAGGAFVESIDIDEGAAGIELIALQTSGVAGALPEIRLSVTQLKDGTIKAFNLKLPPLVSQHRMSWRLIRD